jgi:hypothetical protein
MSDWLIDSIRRLAAVDESDPGDYLLTAADRQLILDLARVAAHQSGERTNAPLICFLVGVARGKDRGSIETLADAAAGERL